MTQTSPITHITTAHSADASGKTLYDMTSSAGFSTLHGAIKAAGLKDTLKANGPFTLFAPTDAAFEKLPPGTLDTLMKSENKEKLVAVLKNHVVTGRFPNKDVKFGSEAQTLGGQFAQLSSYVDVNSLKSDTSCRNGVIHSIDHVVWPH